EPDILRACFRPDAPAGASGPKASSLSLDDHPSMNRPPARPWECPLMRLRIVIPALGLALLAAHGSALALTLDREVRIDPARISVSIVRGVAAVEARGGTREFVAGRPDLPWISERVDLPEGMKLTAVSVVSARTEVIADGVRVPPALSARPGAPEW